MKITVDIEEVASKMRAAKAAKINDSWSGQLLDTLEELYGLERAVSQAVGMDAEEYSSTWEPGDDDNE